MRLSRRVLWVVALIGGAALAGWPARYYWEMASCPAGSGSNCVAAQSCSAGSCTGTAPTTSSTQGLSTSGLTAFSLAICAVSGQTLSGAGSMQAYVYRYGTGLWARAPALDQPVPASCASNRCCAFADMATGVQTDRVYFMASAVTVSSGSTLDVMLDGQPVVAGH